MEKTGLVVITSPEREKKKKRRGGIKIRAFNRQPEEMGGR